MAPPTRTVSDRPLVGVSALVRRDGKVLLVRRERPPLQDQWSLPGGLVEYGERLEDAIVREVHEEAGLTIRQPRRIDVAEVIEPDAGFHYVLIVFAADAASGAIRAGDDAAEARWVEPAALPGLHLTEGTARILAKEPVA